MPYVYLHRVFLFRRFSLITGVWNVTPVNGGGFTTKFKMEIIILTSMSESDLNMTKHLFVWLETMGDHGGLLSSDQPRVTVADTMLSESDIRNIIIILFYLKFILLNYSYWNRLHASQCMRTNDLVLPKWRGQMSIALRLLKVRTVKLSSLLISNTTWHFLLK